MCSSGLHFIYMSILFIIEYLAYDPIFVNDSKFYMTVFIPNLATAMLIHSCFIPRRICLVSTVEPGSQFLLCSFTYGRWGHKSLSSILFIYIIYIYITIAPLVWSALKNSNTFNSIQTHPFYKCCVKLYE